MTSGWPGAYWHETPEEGLRVYRNLASVAYLQEHRLEFAHHTITGWNQADKERAPRLWAAFVQELCGSADPVLKVEGYFLDFADAEPSQQEARAKKFFEVGMENVRQLKESWFGGPIDARGQAFGRAYEIQRRLMEDVSFLLADPPRGFGDTQLIWRIQRLYQAFRDGFDPAYLVIFRKDRLETMTNYLTKQLSAKAVPNPKEFEDLFQRPIPYYSAEPLYKEAEAVVLVPRLRGLQIQLAERAQRSETNAAAALQKVTDLLGSLEPMVAAPASADPATNRPRRPVATAGPPAPEPKPTITRQAALQIPSLAQVSTNSLKVTRFWPWPIKVEPDMGISLSIDGVCFREGRIWMEVRYFLDSVNLRNAFVMALDPNSGSTQTVDLPRVNNKFVLSPTESRDNFETGTSFEVRGDQLFFSLADKIKRYSLSSKAWVDLPVPTSGRLTLLDGRLFAATDDTIAEVSSDGNSQTLLASARRRPPATILDSLEHYGNFSSQPPIFRGPEGALTTRINDRLYVFNERSRDWKEITELPQEPTASGALTNPPQLFLFDARDWRTNRLLLPLDQSSIAMWLPQPACVSRTNYSVRQIEAEDPLWCEPAGRGSAGMRVYLAQSEAWVFFNRRLTARTAAGPAVTTRSQDAPNGDDRLLLQVLWKDTGGLFAIPLELQSKEIDSRSALGARSGAFGHVEVAVQRVPTAAGLLLVNGTLGSWLLPWSDVQSALKAARAERTAQLQAREAAVKTLRANLSEKYHLAQSGDLTPEQKEATIDDPLFLELNLDNIDRNRNGKIDASELAFFDANQNKQLDPPEQAALELAQGLLAQRLFHEFDRNRDGVIDLDELGCLVIDTRDIRPRGLMAPVDLIARFDQNGDGVLSAVELQSFLRQETLLSMGPGNFVQNPQADLSGPALKLAIDNFWNGGRNGPRGATRPSGMPPTARGPVPAVRPPPAPPTNSPPRNPDQALFDAVDSGNVAAARAALEQGAKVDVREDRGWTPLMLAARAGRIEIVKLLVEKGADTKARSTSQTGSTVLCFAVESDNPELLAFLISHGADVNGPSKNLVAPLYTAATSQKQEAARFLISHGARLNERGFVNEIGERYTPLMASVLQEDLEMTKLLVDSGAALEETNRLGDTALMLNARTPRPDILKILIDKGANVNARARLGHTALIYAAYNGHVESIKLLLAAGADPNATASEEPDSPRYDAIDLAKGQNHPEAVALINEAKRKSSAKK